MDNWKIIEYFGQNYASDDLAADIIEIGIFEFRPKIKNMSLWVNRSIFESFFDCITTSFEYTNGYNKRDDCTIRVSKMNVWNKNKINLKENETGSTISFIVDWNNLDIISHQRII